MRTVKHGAPKRPGLHQAAPSPAMPRPATPPKTIRVPRSPARARSPKTPTSARSSRAISASAAKTKEAVAPPKLSDTLKSAAVKALGGGIAGALAMVVQVVALMWMRTTINYQHAKGMSTMEALTTLYNEGGIARLYQGMGVALLQAPISRFGDTAANAGMLALLAGVTWLSPAIKTICASLAAGFFRVAITPLDSLKTILQVGGANGASQLKRRISSDGILTLYSGAFGNVVATFLGHYPWFFTYNYLQAAVPKPASSLKRNVRSAVIGFCSSFTSDVVSNSARVVKTFKQTYQEPISYADAVMLIVHADGVSGLFLRGLGTKLLSNGVQAMLFTVCWRYFEERIAKRQESKATPKKSK